MPARAKSQKPPSNCSSRVNPPMGKAGQFGGVGFELDGCRVDYLLHDQPVRFLKGKLRLRQVTRLCDDGHQTQIITSRRDLRHIEVAYRIFERWRQENFFKYMRKEFLLNALVDYQIEPEGPTRPIPNPERRALDKEIGTARADLARL